MKRTVFYTGNKNAKIIFVGKAPEIDYEGNWNQAKQLLDRHLNKAGFDPNEVLITNTVFWYTPKFTNPSKQDINMCKPFIEKLIALVSPKVLVTLEICQMKKPFYRNYTNVYLNNNIIEYVTYTPFYVLDSKSKRTKEMQQDFRMIKDKLVNMLSPNDLKDKTERLHQLKRRAKSIENCTLKTPQTNFVFSDGNPNARIMFIGEAPSKEADRQGIPFCGATGDFLYARLNEIDLDRSDVFVTNSVFWHPPNDRDPEDDELEACKPFVEELIALVSPQILVFVGKIALRNFNNIQGGILQERGKIFQYNNQYLTEPIVASAIIHPSYINRRDDDPKPSFHENLKMIREQYINSMESM